MAIVINLEQATAASEQAQAERASMLVMPKGVYEAYVNSVEEWISDKKVNDVVIGKSVGFMWSFTILSQVEGFGGELVEDAQRFAGRELNKVYTYVGFMPNGKTEVESAATSWPTVSVLSAIKIDTNENGEAIINNETAARKRLMLQINHKIVPNKNDPEAEPSIYPEVKKYLPVLDAPGSRYDGVDFSVSKKEVQPF